MIYLITVAASHSGWVGALNITSNGVEVCFDN